MLDKAAREFHRSIMKTIVTDILIIGGGLVGGTLACILADQGISTVVVDREAPSDQLDPDYDGRASAIALGTQRVLDGAGLWDDLKDDSAPIDDIRVSDGDSLMFLHYDHNDMEIRPFGYMVENRRLRVALAKRFSGLKKLQVLAPESVVSLDRAAGGVTATLESGKTIQAKLAIGADGRASQTRADAGIDLTQWSYNQSGIVCTVEHEKSHENIAHERFLPAGPFAILPLTGNRSCIVWTERTQMAPAMIALPDDEFNAELARRFGDFLGKTRPTGPRWCYPLSLQFAERVTDKRLALVGDAAHAMHPIAGQGLNMGLRDVAAMAEVLSDAHRLGLDLGTANVLERYEKWRRFDNTLMLAMTDLLNRLFSNDIAPVRLARDVGLAVVNRIPPLKRFFMRHAMGLVGDLPRLMRGERLG
jgi:2-octaprenyl-6-methoxyphenol hydroxylase